MTERVDTQDDGGRNNLNGNGKVQISLFITKTIKKSITQAIKKMYRQTILTLNTVMMNNFG